MGDIVDDCNWFDTSPAPEATSSAGSRSHITVVLFLSSRLDLEDDLL